MFLKGLINKKKKTPSLKIEREDLRSPEVLGVNLVKDEIIVFFDWNKHIFLAIIGLLVVLLFVFEVYSGLNYWEKQEEERVKAMENETMKLRSDIADINKRASAALIYKDKSAAFKDILDNHVYWTNLFAWFEKNTLSSIKYEGFSGTLDGIYNLSATANSYSEASWQAKVFSENPLVKSVSISTVGASGKIEEGDTQIGEVRFQIQLTLDPEVFRSK